MGNNLGGGGGSNTFPGEKIRMKVIKVSLCCTELIQRRGNFIKIPSGLGDCNDKKKHICAVIRFKTGLFCACPSGGGRQAHGGLYR